jgi:hypothetical protein
MMGKSSTRAHIRDVLVLLCGIAVLGGAVGTTASAASATVPGKPTIRAVKAGLFAVTVTFRRPASDGGAQIIGYRVRCTSSNRGATGSQSVKGSPSTVRGLGANKTYRCTVTANNSVGVGPASAPSSAVVAFPRVPGPPTLTSAQAVGLRSITVAFKAPTDTGRAPIKNYRASCTSANGGATHTRLAPHSPIGVNSLTADKTYTCTVAAANNVGLGHASAPSHTVVAFPTVPGAATITSVKPVGLGSVAISVKNPANTGGAPIISYRAACTSSNGGISRSRVASGLPVKVSGLTAGKTYTCTVAAGNGVRRGPPSKPSKPVVPRAH